MRLQPMRFLVPTLALAAGGCQLLYLSPYGKPHDPVWTKQEVVDWYGRFKQPPRFMYRGSDDRWHYFITRPIDDFVHIQIDRKELSIPEEHRCSQEMYFGYYPVDPSNAFRKIDES